MRIAYIANYQGPDLVEKRPVLHNFSLAARVKVQLIAELLRRSSHDVEIISQGALEPLVGRDRFRFKFYPGVAEGERFHPDIPIRYVSALSVKYLIGLWESSQAQRLLEDGHRRAPYQAVIIYNMQRAQVGCAHYALRRLKLPVILQYEDDSFVDVHGHAGYGPLTRRRLSSYKKLLRSMSGGMAVSPYLMDQFPADTPKILLRGVVSDEILKTSQATKGAKKNWVVFSGTHESTQGIEQLIDAWHLLNIPDWELHIAGRGPITPLLQQKASGNPSIIFHGLIGRAENARLLCAARIGMNAQDLSKTPGNVFAFKIVEYLAAGTHVVTTPRGALEPELTAGVTYIADNAPATIAGCLRELIETRGYERTAEEAALQVYGPDAVSNSLSRLLHQVTENRSR